MSDTKACNITKDEVLCLMSYHGASILDGDTEKNVERIKYLNSRLKSFAKTVEELRTEEPAPQPTATTNGWGTN